MVEFNGVSKTYNKEFEALKNLNLSIKQGEFVFSKGPAFCNILLADEINRATPKTQSSLLECMAEHQITIDGVTYPLEEPFLVIATQNPLDTLGTFPLPEAQMDRFLMQLAMEPLDAKDELAMVERFMTDEPLAELTSVCTKEMIVSLQQECRKVYIHPELMNYLISITQATRRHPKIACGVSPRGTLAFVRAAQGFAMVSGRDYVVPEDIKAVAPAVLLHRLVMNITLDGRKSAQSVLDEIFLSLQVPTEDWSKR